MRANGVLSGPGNVAFLVVVNAGLGGGVGMAHDCIEIALFVFNVLLCLGLLVLSTIEIRTGPRRGLWHWIGVCHQFIPILIYPVLLWVYMKLLFAPPNAIR